MRWCTRRDRPPSLCDMRSTPSPDVQHVAGAQGAAAWPPKRPEDEGAAAAQVVGHVEAAGDGQVGAAAGALRARRVRAPSRPATATACQRGSGAPSSVRRNPRR